VQQAQQETRALRTLRYDHYSSEDNNEAPTINGGNIGGQTQIQNYFSPEIGSDDLFWVMGNAPESSRGFPAPTHEVNSTSDFEYDWRNLELPEICDLLSGASAY
jgi:hypothetical protein